MANPKLTVSIVTYNSSGHIAHCLDALLESKADFKFEIIVVDNNSSDNTRDIVASYKDKIRLIANPENVGFGRGHNLAAKESAGQYLFILNPDTTVQPDSLAQLETNLGSNTLVAPRLMFPGGELQRSAHRRFPSWISHFVQYNFLLFTAIQKLSPGYDYTLYPTQDHQHVLHPKHVMGAAMIIETEKFKELGGFDSHFFLYLEETDLCLRLRAKGGLIVYDPKIIVFHNLGDSTGGSSSFGQGSPFYMRSEYYYFRKNKGRIYAGALYCLTTIVSGLNLLVLQLIKLAHKTGLASGQGRQVEVGWEFMSTVFKWHWSNLRKEL